MTILRRAGTARLVVLREALENWGFAVALLGGQCPPYCGRGALS